MGGVCVLLYDDRMGIGGNKIYFLTCFVRGPARGAVSLVILTT